MSQAVMPDLCGPAPAISRSNEGKSNRISCIVTGCDRSEELWCTTVHIFNKILKIPINTRLDSICVRKFCGDNSEP